MNVVLLKAGFTYKSLKQIIITVLNKIHFIVKAPVHKASDIQLYCTDRLLSVFHVVTVWFGVYEVLKLKIKPISSDP